MKKQILQAFLFVFISLYTGQISAQIHLEGSVQIDMNSGLIQCDLMLSKIPEIKELRILLNRGMNVKYYKGYNGELIEYDGFYDGKMNGEAIEYTLKVDSVFPLKEIKVTYVGAFPIYSEDYNWFDYKGFIAFNDKTVRATEQSKWYPVIYDGLNDKLINNYTYNLAVSIKGGNTIFVNGSAPKKGNAVNLVSEKAHPLLLFAGTYSFVESKKDYILNADISKEDTKAIFKNIGHIKNNLSKNLGVVFTDNIYLIHHKAIDKKRNESIWGFNTYPTFAFSGLNFKDLVDDKRKKFSNGHIKYFGHELAHNYFGNNVVSGTLKWFWLESFSEYLSYNIAEDLVGPKFLAQVIHDQLSNLNEDDTFIPLDKVKVQNEIGEKYRYILAPLLLKCFEDRFGRVKMNSTIKSLLEFSKSETLTLDHFKKSAVESGIKIEEFEEFQKEFITSERFKQNIIKEIQKNYPPVSNN